MPRESPLFMGIWEAGSTRIVGNVSLFDAASAGGLAISGNQNPM
jgi:hypothetical protein